MTPESPGMIGCSRQARLRTVEDTRAWGARLGALLTTGDQLVLTGDLGPGQTTLAQGIRDGPSVRGPLTCPTCRMRRLTPPPARAPGE